MNKSVMKCCICNNENIGQFITINNKKYHLCCIEQLQQENQKQKEVIDDCKEDISNLLDIINKNCNELKCTSDEWLVIQKYQDKEVE